MIQTRIEQKRGCGYRKKGGIYLVSDGVATTCYKMPVPLTVCPCCSAGIKPTRGFTWISSDLFANIPCSDRFCLGCPMDKKSLRMGLLWVGEKFYPKPSDFNDEAARLGISRRISQVPRDLKIGETWICFAHRKAIKNPEPIGEDILPESIVNAAGFETVPFDEYTAGIFKAFIPTRIEYIVKGTETEEEIEALEKRGFTLINVIPDSETQQAPIPDELEV